jgi:hypothetical protein
VVNAVSPVITNGCPVNCTLYDTRVKFFCTTEVYGFASKRVCTRAPKIISAVQKNLTRVSYNVQLTGQPFVITGDTALTTVDLGGGAESVQVLFFFCLGLIRDFFFSSRPPSIYSKKPEP